jgi:hypothetical protein
MLSAAPPILELCTFDKEPSLLSLAEGHMQIDGICVLPQVLSRRGCPEQMCPGENYENRIANLERLDCSCSITINRTAPTLHEMLLDERSYSLPSRLSA